jgi:hypothetical protein
MLGVSLLLGLAPSARAGLVNLPFDLDVCGEIDVVGQMSDPNASYDAGIPEPICERLCKKAGEHCRAAVKDTAACQIRVFKEIDPYAKANCEIQFEGDPAGRKECNREIRDAINSEIGDIKAARDDALEACPAWTQTCLASCSDL